MDYRKLRNIMRLIVNSRCYNDDFITECVRYFTLALGLCSYKTQVAMLESFVSQVRAKVKNPEELEFVESRINYMKHFDITAGQANPFEPEGVRVGETQIDANIMLFLKELLADICDGFIAPRMFSPFHVGDTTHEEIVIFDPKKAGLKVYDGKLKIEQYHINTLIKSRCIVLKYRDCFERTINMDGGGGGKDYLFDKNLAFDDAEFVAESKKKAKRFKAAIGFKVLTCIAKPNLAT
jgi:hypothetical protein